MNNPFDYTPDKACETAFRELVIKLEKLKRSEREEDINFCRELEEGKMLGVLIATDDCGVSHTLYAFSGQLGNGGFHYPGFVGPVFDYLHPDGYFKTNEAIISQQNKEIASFEAGALAEIRSAYSIRKKQVDKEITEYKKYCRQSKQERDLKRKSGMIDEKEMAELIRCSQFEKAELQRLKKRLTQSLQPFTDRLMQAKSHLEDLKEKRRSDSENLQQWLFTNFKLLNARGESRCLNEIFADTPMKIPPSGAGECCAPKLLQAAYLKGWHPVTMAEYWYGKPKRGEVRIHGMHYPACRGKCLPILSWMLQGLSVSSSLDKGHDNPIVQAPEIIYENEWFCIVNKPSGMLSVPGKGAAISLQRWLQEKYGAEKCVKLSHRLDQDTSGLIVATFGQLSFKTMQALFATRKARKTYVAELEGDYTSFGIPPQGRISLPLSPDWLDRPRQRVDMEGGKEAVTDYLFTGVSEGRSRIEFHPLTGRTHQLRMHSASEIGLGMPIIGDRLYGTSKENCTQRLCLHSHKLEFTFPLDGEHYYFECPVPF